MHIEWRSGSDKQADQCRIGQSANATGSGSNFFIATNSADSGSSTTRLTVQSDGTIVTGDVSIPTSSIPLPFHSKSYPSFLNVISVNCLTV